MHQALRATSLVLAGLVLILWQFPPEPWQTPSGPLGTGEQVYDPHDHDEEDFDPSVPQKTAAAPLGPDEKAPFAPFALEAEPAVPLAADRVLRFVIIGDFGLDGYKPKTAAPVAPAKPKDEKTKVEAPQAGVKAPEPAVAPPTASEPLANPRQAAVARRVADWRPDFVVTTGDNNYPRGEAATIDRNIGKYYAPFIGGYRGAFGPGADVNRFFPVLGNHDWDAPKAGCKAYLDYFTLPGNERYYEFVQGPIHFFMLDTDAREPDGVKVGSKQHAWFVKAVAASRAPFQVVVSHHPPFSSGQHGDNKSAQWGFEKYGVDLVVSGHDHDYERIERAGLQHVVNGSGGANLRKFGKVVPGSQVRYRQKHGAMRFDVVANGSDLELLGRFVTLDGEEVDAFSIVRPRAK